MSKTVLLLGVCVMFLILRVMLGIATRNGLLENIKNRQLVSNGITALAFVAGLTIAMI